MIGRYANVSKKSLLLLIAYVNIVERMFLCFYETKVSIMFEVENIENKYKHRSTHFSYCDYADLPFSFTLDVSKCTFIWFI